MTRNEAITYLKDFKTQSWDGMPEEVIDMAIKSLEAWEDTLQYLDKVNPVVYPRTQGFIDCLRQIYKEHMGDE